MPRHVHEVSFYADDAECVDALAAYFAEGLNRQERVLAVCTDAHGVALDRALVALGIDVDDARRRGDYVRLGARETLARLQSDGRVIGRLVEEHIGSLLDELLSAGRPVRAYGEMVALLWDDADVVGAIELESQWNGLAVHREFSLLCSYPASILDGSGSVEDVSRICEVHSRVLTPTGYERSLPLPAEDIEVQESGIFVPVAEAVSAARSFVTDVLQGWGEAGAVDDASLVTSEIATNAVLHGDSAFRARVVRADGTLRIAIEDAMPADVRARVADTDDLTGRGMLIVEALSTRWGCDRLPAGKVVWAELPAATG